MLTAQVEQFLSAAATYVPRNIDTECRPCAVPSQKLAQTDETSAKQPGEK